MSQSTRVAVIGDLVGSRAQPDRTAAQRDLVDTLSRVNDMVEAVQPLEPTIGDECQGAYADVPAALRATLLVRLMLSAPLDCRFGIGAGTFETVGRSEYGLMQDGPAWWAARAAIVEGESREVRKQRSLRTWYVVDDAVPQGSRELPEAAMTNAYLSTRDQIIGGMNDRSRRLLLGLLDGRTQVELARTEDITQSAVSQNLQRSGAYAILAGAELIGAAS